MKSMYHLLLWALLVVTSCATPLPYNDPIPEHESFTLQSKRLGELRTLNVWTPPEYATSGDSLPVLYMPDGGIQEDFPHIANTLADLIHTGKIKPIMLVGIENIQRRKDLTGPTSVEEDKKIAPLFGGSEAFRAFIRDELMPEINTRYRTTNEKGIIGESLAGLFVTETLLLSPELFDFYIAFDPSLWWNNEHLTQTAHEHLADFPTAPKTFWFAGSSAADISSTAGKFSDSLKSQNISNLKWSYTAKPQEKHSTIFRAAKEQAIIWTLGHP